MGGMACPFALPLPARGAERMSSKQKASSLVNVAQAEGLARGDEPEQGSGVSRARAADPGGPSRMRGGRAGCSNMRRRGREMTRASPTPWIRWPRKLSRELHSSRTPSMGRRQFLSPVAMSKDSGALPSSIFPLPSSIFPFPLPPPPFRFPLPASPFITYSSYRNVGARACEDGVTGYSLW
jgi:hypothetical protein